MVENKMQRQRMVEPEEKLWRTIPQPWVANGRVTNLAFRPTPHDAGYLSICRSQAISAEDAYQERSEQIRKRCEDQGKPHKPPAGVLSVTVAEVEEVSMDDGSTPLTVWDDSATENVPDYHGHIDFSPIVGNKDQVNTASDILTSVARARGWEYSP